MLDKQGLKHWAIILEREMRENSDQSEAVVSLMKYKDLMDAIESAKNDVINKPICLPALTYYLFETDLRAFKSLTTALSSFTLLLEGLAIPPETPNQPPGEGP